MKASIPCPHDSRGQRDLAPLYLAGRLTEEDAEAFEAHFFACPKCREDVLAGAALREVYGKPGVAASGRPAPARWSWLPFAAAAAIAFVALGVWELGRRTVEEPGSTLRGSAAALPVKVETGLPGGIALSWPPSPAAATYRVQVFASDGTRVWSAEAGEPRLNIGPGVLPTPRPAQSFEVEVQALDSIGQVIATSDPIPLEATR